MIRIPAGKYHVGSTNAERQALATRYGFDPSFLGDELDAKVVELPEFFIDAYPVTNAEYAAFIAATGAPEPYDWPLHATPERANHPVVGVGGENALAYAEWVGKRLPTPEQWEAAFQGLPQQADRKVVGNHWMPKTHATTSDPGPRSEFGVHGFGQVCEWTTATMMNGPHPFRLMKGAWWMAEEAWGRRPAASIWGFAPWCRQWTGLRCVSDTDIASTPTGTLNEAAPNYHFNPVDSTRKAVSFVTGGHGGAGVNFPGLCEGIGVAAPEGLTVDNDPAPPFEVELTNGTVAGFEIPEVSYTLKAADVDLQIRFKGGNDFFDLDYTVVNRRTVPVRMCPSACMNAGLSDPFYDLEGSRTYILFGNGQWAPLRSLPRTGLVKRWISYAALPEPCPETVMVGVVGRDTPWVFGYGRVGLTEPLKIANNYCFSCLHLDPTILAPPNASASTHARIYCMQGGLDDLRARFLKEFSL